MSVLINELPSRLRSRVAPLIKEARDRQRRRRLWVALVALAVVLFATAGYGLSRASGSHAQAACAASGQCGRALSGSPAVPNPCTLITNAEAAKFLGNPVQYRTPDAMRGKSDKRRTCTWTAVPFSSFGYNGNRFTMSLTPMTRARFATGLLAMRRSVPVRGIGQLAYRTTGPAYFVSAFDHGYAVVVSGYSPDQINGEEQLAKVILTRVR
jgi:hypothetical protein